jgi:hypothetical protein
VRGTWPNSILGPSNGRKLHTPLPVRHSGGGRPRRLMHQCVNNTR